jgi:ubiquinone biosynthesis accessory factor UbiJ
VAALRLDPAAVPAALANRVLAREQWARSCLATHAGRVFRVVVAPVATTMRIDATGSIEPASASDGTLDLTLTLSPLKVPSSLADPTRWDALVTVDGDPALAATLKGLAETLPWFVERAFAEALGPIAGQFVADAGRRMLAFPGYAGGRVGDSVASYVRDEVALAATSAEARSIGDEIAETASRVDALAARVDALAARLAARLPKS